MIKALIFDLDNCLAAASEVGDHVFEPAFEAMRRANQGRLSEETLRAAFADCWRHPLDWVADRHGFSQEMLRAGWEVFSKTEIKTRMYGYGDLSVLNELPGMRFLVTSGFRLLQESKISALRLDDCFTEIHVDAIDEPKRKGKQAIFEEILKRHRLVTSEVLVVGDNPESELLAGTRLGLQTVQTLRPGVTRSDLANFHVHSLTELWELLGTMEK